MYLVRQHVSNEKGDSFLLLAIIIRFNIYWVTKRYPPVQSSTHRGHLKRVRSLWRYSETYFQLVLGTPGYRLSKVERDAPLLAVKGVCCRFCYVRQHGGVHAA